MENSHKLGIYVSYYLSRFDEKAYQMLGCRNQGEIHKKIGELLSVNPHTVKNWRDKFGPLFGHRIGWLPVLVWEGEIRDHPTTTLLRYNKFWKSVQLKF